MGRVAGSYGLRGWVKVKPQGGAGQGLIAAREWWIGADAYEVRGAKLHGATVVGKPAGIETPEQAAALTGYTVAVRREALPSPGEGRYYLADLVGLQVVNVQGEALGVVQRIFSNGAQDVIEVAAEGRIRLLPWVAAIVQDVDLANRRIRVAWEADW
jgi:16S rRNA processing protein RimM